MADAMVPDRDRDEAPGADADEIREADFLAYREMTSPVGGPGRIPNHIRDTVPDPDAELLAGLDSAGFVELRRGERGYPAWVDDPSLTVSLAKVRESIAFEKAMRPGVVID